MRIAAEEGGDSRTEHDDDHLGDDAVLVKERGGDATGASISPVDSALGSSSSRQGGGGVTRHARQAERATFVSMAAVSASVVFLLAVAFVSSFRGECAAQLNAPGEGRAYMADTVVVEVRRKILHIAAVEGARSHAVGSKVSQTVWWLKSVKTSSVVSERAAWGVDHEVRRGGCEKRSRSADGNAVSLFSPSCMGCS